MVHYFLGIDTGSTKSLALIADESGRAVGLGRAGGGNWETVGLEGCRQVLEEITRQALAAAGLARREITAAGFCLAGYDWPEDRPALEEVIGSLGLEAPYELVNDAMAGLLAGTTEGWGVGVSAGTSCNCYGRDRQGRTGRVVGSSRFGEYAGAGEIVWRAMQAVARAWTRRGPATKLSQALAWAAGARGVEDLVAGLMRGRYRLAPAMAPIVFECAGAGDVVAREIIEWAGRGLADLAAGVARQLDFQGTAFEVILAGSVLDGNPELATLVSAALVEEFPLARPLRLDAPPVAGAVRLAMEQVGLDTAEIRPRLVGSSRALVREEEGCSRPRWLGD
jgi:N-acetylglucosamine kinase-like BadF-type ATPase